MPLRDPRTGRYIKTTRVVLRESRKGRNKRGVCLHKAAKSRVKKAKRQNVPGWAPQPVTAYSMRRS